MSKGKYFDGRSALSRQVDLFIENGHLRADHAGETIARWPLELIYRDETQIVAVVIGCGPGDDRIELLDPAFGAQLGLKTSTWSKHELNKHEMPMLAGLAAVLLLAGVLLWNSRILTRYLAAKVPSQTETALLNLVRGQLADDMCRPTEAQQAAADKMMERLFISEPAFRSQVHVRFVKSDTKNAFTLPGGEIWVFSALLNDMKSPDELAGVLAHEIEHVKKRHVMEALIRATLFSGLMTVLYGDVSGFVLVDPATASQLLGLRLSREMEAEADDGALQRLRAGNISPAGMAAFFKRLKGLDSKLMNFLSTHPGHQERAERFEQAAIDFEETEAVLSTEEWTDLKNSCGASM